MKTQDPNCHGQEESGSRNHPHHIPILILIPNPNPNPNNSTPIKRILHIPQANPSYQPPTNPGFNHPIEIALDVTANATAATSRTLT